MTTKSRSLLEPNFWRYSAMIWGFSTGNIVVLALAVAAAYSLFHSLLATEIACGLVLLLSVPLSVYLIRVNTLGREMRSPAAIIGGFIACVVGGAIIPLVFLPMLVLATCKAIKDASTTHTGTGKEKFFSLPGSVAKHAEQELAASFFTETKE